MVKLNAVIRPCIIANVDKIQFGNMKTADVSFQEKNAEIEA